MQRLYLRWGLYALFVAISCLFYYRSSHKARLMEQLRFRQVTLASPIFDRPAANKNDDAYMYFRTREYPDVQFNVSRARYELLAKELMVEVVARDTIEIWIKDNVESVSPYETEHQVYGIYQGETTYLDLDQVLRREKRSKLFGNIMLLVLLFVLVIYDYVKGRREASND
ncbi:MAG: hypothetical protein AAFO02_25330 [Bacteroidota bacterium]